MEPRTVCERAGRVDLLAAEGVRFVTGAEVGGEDPAFGAVRVRDAHDAMVLALGATKPRDLPVPGRERARRLFFRRAPTRAV